MIRSLLLLLPAVCGVTAFAQTDNLERDLKTAKRIVNAQTIDISPLIRWEHDKATTERPLKAWVHVSGRLIGENIYGWIVQASLDSPSQAATITLKNPPRTAVAEFKQLKSQYAALLKRRESLAAQIAETDRAFNETKSAYRRANLYFVDERDSRFDQLRVLRENLTRLDGDIQKFDKKGHDLSGEFKVNCYAMRTGLLFNGIQIYDHGAIMR